MESLSTRYNFNQVVLGRLEDSAGLGVKQVRGLSRSGGLAGPAKPLDLPNPLNSLNSHHPTFLCCFLQMKVI